MDIINKIKEFINIEADARIKKQNELMALPLKQRISKGEAHAQLEEVELEKVVKSTNEFQHKALAWASNNSKFKVGDYVKIHKGDLSDEANVYRASIVNEGINFFIIARDPFAGKIFQKEEGVIWIMERDNPDLRRFFIDALNTFPFISQKNKILDIIQGETEPSYELKGVKEAINIANYHPFNRMQRKAFIRAYSTIDYTIIQGPPGTGKTWLLAHIAIALAKKGQKVLITSLTHRAVNNALMKIREISEYKNVIKVGQFFNQDDLEKYDIICHEFFKSNNIKEYAEQGIIIGGSPFALHTSRLKEIDFDTVIFDEASQMVISQTVTSMMKAKKYIFIGDHKQMPPIFNSKHKDSLLSKSLFENLIRRKNNSIMLNITYRMNKEINHFPSTNFYNKELVSHNSIVKSRYVHDIALLPELSLMLDPEEPSVAIKFDHDGNKMYSDEEAYLVALLSIALLRVGVAPKDIGVIVPYRAQARKIRSIINKLADDLLEQTREVLVDTVERMQGQEREVIMISMASSDPQFITENAEFIFNPNRFNVAITRAKNKRIFICSNNLLNAKSDDCQNNIDDFNRLFEDSIILNMGIQNGK